jgi:hypothetical protein
MDWHLDVIPCGGPWRNDRGHARSGSGQDGRRLQQNIDMRDIGDMEGDGIGMRHSLLMKEDGHYPVGYFISRKKKSVKEN